MIAHGHNVWTTHVNAEWPQTLRCRGPREIVVNAVRQTGPRNGLNGTLTVRAVCAGPP